MRTDVLVTVEELATALADDEPPAVLDVRWALGRTDAHERYLAGHVPGAVYVDLATELAGPPNAAGGRHPLPDVADLEATSGSGWRPPAALGGPAARSRGRTRRPAHGRRGTARARRCGRAPQRQRSEHGGRLQSSPRAPSPLSTVTSTSVLIGPPAATASCTHRRCPGCARTTEPSIWNPAVS